LYNKRKNQTGKLAVKSLVIAATALLSSTFLISSAQAEPRWPNWYVGLHGSLSFVNDGDVRGAPAADEVRYDTGFGYGASLGYRPAVDGGNWRNLRAEVEWHHQESDIDKITSPGGASLNGVGDVNVNAYMVNLFYDATFRDDNMRQALTPYFGGGLGLARFSLNDTTPALGNVSDEDTQLAAQLLAGISYAPEFMPFTEWTLGYRYFTTADAKFSNTTGGTYKMEYDSHNVELGARFLF